MADFYEGFEAVVGNPFASGALGVVVGYVLKALRDDRLLFNSVADAVADGIEKHHGRAAIDRHISDAQLFQLVRLQHRWNRRRCQRAVDEYKAANKADIKRTEQRGKFVVDSERFKKAIEALELFTRRR